MSHASGQLGHTLSRAIMTNVLRVLGGGHASDDSTHCCWGLLLGLLLGAAWTQDSDRVLSTHE